MELIERLKYWARRIKRDVHAVYLASKDSRVPSYVKAMCIAVAAYALSPIDLIPDFIPVIGYLDDLVIVPLGIALVVHLIPPELMIEHRQSAADAQDRPTSVAGAAAIVALWTTAVLLSSWFCYARFA